MNYVWGLKRPKTLINAINLYMVRFSERCTHYRNALMTIYFMLYQFDPKQKLLQDKRLFKVK